MIYNPETNNVTLSLEELTSAIAAALKEVKIYVLESEITAAQQAVKAVVEQANIEVEL
jgi:hypothetical protein